MEKSLVTLLEIQHGKQTPPKYFLGSELSNFFGEMNKAHIHWLCQSNPNPVKNCGGGVTAKMQVKAQRKFTSKQC